MSIKYALNIGKNAEKNTSNSIHRKRNKLYALRIHPKTSFYCDWLQSWWICVVGKKGSRCVTACLRAFFTSSLDHGLFARSRHKTGFGKDSSHYSKTISSMYPFSGLYRCFWSILYIRLINFHFSLADASLLVF